MKVAYPALIFSSLFLILHSHPTYAELKDNKAEARKTLNEKYEKVILGKEIDHLEYAKFLASLPAGPAGVTAYLTDLATSIAKETGQQLAIETIYDLISGHSDNTIVSGKPVYINLQTYNHWDETTIPCLHMTALHPSGDEIPLPCAHIGPIHDFHKVLGKKVRCWHLGPMHPGGHVNHVPCVHLHPAHDPHHIHTPLPNTHQFYIAIGKK
jgi:hypothetical protein